MSQDAFPFVEGDGYDPHSPALNVGNTSDDDASIIDNDFLEVDMLPEKIPTESVVAVTDRPKKTTRLLTGTQVIPAGGLPMPLMILPLDARRLSLAVTCRSLTTVATDFVRLSDDGNKTETVSGSYLLFHASSAYNPDNSTNPVFVHGKDLSAPAYVTWWAVTE